MPDDPAQRPEEAPLSVDKTSAIVRMIVDEPTKSGAVRAFRSGAQARPGSAARPGKPLAQVPPDWMLGAKWARVQPRGTAGVQYSPAAVDRLPKEIPSSGLPTAPAAAAPHHAHAPVR